MDVWGSNETVVNTANCRSVITAESQSGSTRGSNMNPPTICPMPPRATPTSVPWGKVLASKNQIHTNP